VLTNVGQFDSVRLEPLHRHDGATDGMSAGHDERVSVTTALKELLLFDVGLEVRHRINLTDECTFLRIRRREELLIGLCPFGSPGVYLWLQGKRAAIADAGGLLVVLL